MAHNSDYATNAAVTTVFTSKSPTDKDRSAMTTTRNLTSRIALTVGALLTASSTGMAAWQPHEIRQQNGKDPQIRLPAQFQIVTESWNRVVAVPYIIYMPEKDRLRLS